MNLTDLMPYIALLVLIFSGLLTYALLKRFPSLYWGRTPTRTVTTQLDWRFLYRKELRLYRKRLYRYLVNTHQISDWRDLNTVTYTVGQSEAFSYGTLRRHAVVILTDPTLTGPNGSNSPEKSFEHYPKERRSSASSERKLGSSSSS